MTNPEISRLEAFKSLMHEWHETHNPNVRARINKEISFVKKILHRTKTSKNITMVPPRLLGGMIMDDVDPFTYIFNAPYGLDEGIFNLVMDSVDEAIGVIENQDSEESMTVSTSSVNFTSSTSKKDLGKVFIVHGRDISLKDSVARFIEKLGLKPIVLAEQENSGKTIIEKFEQYSDVPCAIIVMSPDDIGYLATEENRKYRRARQNVILEYGYFIGKLGRDKVISLVQGEIEFPSDISGLLHIQVGNTEVWQIQLAKELKSAGYHIDLNDLA